LHAIRSPPCLAGRLRPGGSRGAPPATGRAIALRPPAPPTEAFGPFAPESRVRAASPRLGGSAGSESIRPAGVEIRAEPLDHPAGPGRPRSRASRSGSPVLRVADPILPPIHRWS